eukprot:SAG11_NODE_3552_length_2375_cov_4.429262_1_plen_196_part_00
MIEVGNGVFVPATPAASGVGIGDGGGSASVGGVSGGSKSKSKIKSKSTLCVAAQQTRPQATYYQTLHIFSCSLLCADPLRLTSSLPTRHRCRSAVHLNCSWSWRRPRTYWRTMMNLARSDVISVMLSPKPTHHLRCFRPLSCSHSLNWSRPLSWRRRHEIGSDKTFVRNEFFTLKLHDSSIDTGTQHILRVIIAP